MPYGKRKRSEKKSNRRYKRRRFGKRRGRSNAVIRSAPGMLGKTFAKKFRYCDQINIDAGISTPTVHTFRVNSLFDPDLTGVGHQPIATDQLLGVFYNHATVISAKLSVTFITLGTSNPCVVGIEVSNSATPTTTLNDIYEQGKTVYKVLTGQGAGQKCTITRRISVKRMAGVSNLLDNQDYRCTIAANPAEVVYAHVFVASPDPGTIDPPSTSCQVRLDQFAVLTEPIPLAGS